ncbi:acetoacetate decarboxylase family protein [Dactylosporangium sp. NPDC050688]|uniref:acetoacetate decarboxylase family protein n=1 Tax=Dactylosporangium sp. NPDC050688 TaxID=3157217 RepID=UPI0033F0D088
MEGSPSMSYPPPPWSLRGRMHVSVWAVPVADLPALPLELAGAVRVLRLGRRGLVGTAWVDYRPGGDLSYRELLCAVLTRAGWRPRVTITHIWVDSVASRDGGRALWGIPKDLADLTLPAGPATDAVAGSAAGPATDAVAGSAGGSATDAVAGSAGGSAGGSAADAVGAGGSATATGAGTARASTTQGPIAAAELPRGDGWPPRLPVVFRVVQALAGRPCTTPVRSTARYAPARVAWTVAQEGPLRFLAGRRPLVSFVAGDFKMRFGVAARATAAP